MVAVTELKVLVLSDSHSEYGKIAEAYDAENPDYVLFLGDGEYDFRDFLSMHSGIKVYCVKGNCDFFSTLCESALIKIGGVKIYMCHGHRHGVKNDLTILADTAFNLKAGLALYGHTHRQNITVSRNVVCFNPGSIGKNGEYGIITINGDTFDCQFKSI